jgi:hypothetical protein
MSSMGEPTPTSVYWKDDNVKDEGAPHRENFNEQNYLQQFKINNTVIVFQDVIMAFFLV